MSNIVVIAGSVQAVSILASGPETNTVTVLAASSSSVSVDGGGSLPVSVPAPDNVIFNTSVPGNMGSVGPDGATGATGPTGSAGADGNRLPGESGTQVRVSFGLTPLDSKEFTIVDANVNANSTIIAALSYEFDDPKKDADELTMDSLNIICGQCTAGTFQMFISSHDGSYLHGNFDINYIITLEP